jgi:hypothetical protein
MGIARRKAGTVVSCPTCQGQVVVPTPEPALQPVPMPPPAPGAEQRQPGSNVFERQDFDENLFNPHPATVPQPLPPAGPQPAMVPPVQPNPLADLEHSSIMEPLRPRGVVLTRGQLTGLFVGAAIGGLVLFGLGVLVGRAL